MAPLELLLHVLLDQVHRNVARPLVHHLHVVLPRDAGEFALGLQFGELGLVVGIGDASRPESVAEREGDVIRRHDLADLAEVGVEERLLVVGQAPLGDDAAAARDDPRHPPGRHRDVGEQHAGVHGEVVDSLLGLLDQGVAVCLPGEILRDTADLFQRLVDRHRADRYGSIAEDPLPRLVNVLAGGEIHHGVGAPERGPAQLLDLLIDRGDHGGVADVGVDLHVEAATDDHRLDLGGIDVGRDDRSATRHLAPYELGRESLPQRDELHFGSDLAATGVMHLGDAAVAPEHRAAKSRRHGDPQRLITVRTLRHIAGTNP